MSEAFAVATVGSHLNTDTLAFLPVTPTSSTEWVTYARYYIIVDVSITPGQVTDVTMMLCILSFLLFPKCISIGLGLLHDNVRLPAASFVRSSSQPIVSALPPCQLPLKII